MSRDDGLRLMPAEQNPTTMYVQMFVSDCLAIVTIKGVLQPSNLLCTEKKQCGCDGSNPNSLPIS